MVKSDIDRVIAKLKQGWCIEYYARTSNNVRCGANNPEACQWCLVGAFQATNTVHYPFRIWLFERLGSTPSFFNDYEAESVDDVIAVLEEYKATLPN